ncbi:MAG TPA: macro domain-containing protein [Arachidicoccus sp.]|nr:macro domain-containing protein [Arachidicoccus sp.]
MIKFITGNLLESSAEALINTVNLVGVMGKGIALQFKNAYPSNFKAYKIAVQNNEIGIGRLFVYKDSNIDGEKIIINFPTKTDWRKPSEYEYIDLGLDDLITVIKRFKIKSIAIPPLGAGNGGLRWEKVKTMIEQRLGDLQIEILVFEPSNSIKEQLKKERVKLTDARALLLYVLYDLVSNGEYVSEFSSEKVCYFLQKFGAQKYFKLEFEPNFYGPYSSKVRFVLKALNGSYLMGYSDMNKKPFEPLTLVEDGYSTVKKYIENNKVLHDIALKTMKFLNGFYSDFALELLSTLDYISKKENTLEPNKVAAKLVEWSERKHSMLSDSYYFDMSLNHLKRVSIA